MSALGFNTLTADLQSLELLMSKAILKNINLTYFRTQIGFLSVIGLLSLLPFNVNANDKKTTYRCDLKEIINKKNIESQVSLEVYPDHLLALETTKVEKKSFYILKVKRKFLNIKDEKKDDAVHLWYSFVTLKGDYEAANEFPASKNNQEAMLIYLSHPNDDKTKLEIYINRLFYSHEKTENIDFKGFVSRIELKRINKYQS